MHARRFIMLDYPVLMSLCHSLDTTKNTAENVVLKDSTAIRGKGAIDGNGWWGEYAVHSE